MKIDVKIKKYLIPLTENRRHLRLLSTSENNPHALAMLLQQGLQVKRLAQRGTGDIAR